MVRIEDGNDLPDDKDHHILKDELIRLMGKAAKDAGIDQQVLRKVVVYRPEDK